jgi:hypothetical protein
MTPAEAILERLAAWRPTGPGPHVTRVEAAGGALTLTADRADELSCRLTELAVSFPAGDDCTAAELTGLAVNAAAVKGLSEPLTVYEVDSTRRVAKLRSATPVVRAGQRLYFELTLSGRRQATLTRYAGAATGGRQAVPFAMTHESIAKVAEELLGASAAS